LAGYRWTEVVKYSGRPVTGIPFVKFTFRSDWNSWANPQQYGGQRDEAWDFRILRGWKEASRVGELCRKEAEKKADDGWIVCGVRDTRLGGASLRDAV